MIDVSLEMPDKVRELQIKLYRKAKNEPGFRFYQLYDQVYREDILWRAWVLAKANDGSPGRDDESFADIESKGLMKWLNGLRKDLHDRTYRPQPVRRVMVEKPGGGERPLGIVALRARPSRRFGTAWRKPPPSWYWTNLRGGPGAECIRLPAEAKCAGCDSEGG